MGALSSQPNHVVHKTVLLTHWFRRITRQYSSHTKTLVPKGAQWPFCYIRSHWYFKFHMAGGGPWYRFYRYIHQNTLDLFHLCSTSKIKIFPMLFHFQEVPLLRTNNLLTGVLFNHCTDFNVVMSQTPLFQHDLCNTTRNNVSICTTQRLEIMVI